jgi:hypothetical protein
MKRTLQRSQPPDWEAIALTYRTGVLSVREIARQHEISHTAIQKHAKEKGWSRDLSHRVRKSVVTRLVAGVATEMPLPNNEQEAVELAAATIVQIVREHRAYIRKNRNLAATLYEQLAGAVGSRAALEALIEEETRVSDDAPKAEHQAAFAKRQAMLKAVSLPTHISALKDLSLILKNLIPLEREAFTLEGERDQPQNAGAAPSGLAALEAKLKAIATREAV